MKCFGDKTKLFHCKVVLLDEQELIQEVQETTSGQDLLDVVFQHLNLIETAYFGLRYIDPSNQTHWLDPNKRLVKQLKGLSPYTLYFSVKFYAADPTKLVEEITRYQFFLQIKQDILQGRLPISTELAAELGSLAVQSELGDYDPRRHSPGYVSEFRFVTNQTVPLENKIAELHKKLVSYVPSKAELCYLEKVKWLDMYGVDLHPVLGEDSTEYFLGLTPSGIIVLRNKAKVGNYFWPRITKVYFKGRFFMLRVKDKNNVENTYGFETPSKSACKHLWQCCVEHHAFFRLTQAAGNSPQAIFSIGSKFRYSGRTEKEALNDAKANARPQTEFARTPSRRYQRRIIEGNQDTPRVEDTEAKPETRTVVSLPGTVTPVSHVYRSTSMTLAPRSDSPRSTRSAPHNTAIQRQVHSVLGTTTRREGRAPSRGESPGSVKSTSTARTPDGTERVPRRTSSVESQSSADSRSCNRSCSRHRRSRCRSSDGESEASSKCSSSKGNRRHHHHRHHHRRHRHHSDDSSDHHKHRHRRHRHSKSSDKQEPQMIESSDQWAKVQNGDTPSKTNTATVRDLTSGYMPSGHDDTEADSHANRPSSRRKHRKHRSPSDSKQKGYPEEIRRHIEFNLQNTEGLSESQLKEIPYTKIETAKTVKIKYGSPKGKRHKSPKRSKSNSSERKTTEDSERHHKNKTTNGLENDSSYSGNNMAEDKNAQKNENENKLLNGSIKPCPRSSQDSVPQDRIHEVSPQDGRSATSPRSSPNRDSSHPRSYQEVGTLLKHQKENHRSSYPQGYGHKPTTTTNNQLPNSHTNGNSKLSYNNHTLYNNHQNNSNHHNSDQTMFKTSNYVTSTFNNASNNSTNSRTQSPHLNHRSDGAFLPLHRDSNLEDHLRYRREQIGDENEEDNIGYGDSTGRDLMNQCPPLMKNVIMEKGSHFTAVLKPQPSPQSSVTSGISVGSSSASTTVAENSEGEFQKLSSSHEDFLPLMYNNENKFITERKVFPSNVINGLHGIKQNFANNFPTKNQYQKPYLDVNGLGSKEKINNIEHCATFPPKEKSNIIFRGEMTERYDDISLDKGYHTTGRGSSRNSINYQNNNLSQTTKLAKDRPNSFSYNQNLVNETTKHNEYNPNYFEKSNDSPRAFKPILKSFASEDNLNSPVYLKTKSMSTERLDNVSSLSTNKGRVRWNIQEKTKNMINLKDGNAHYKNRDTTISRTKPNNIHNIKNDVVYAGRGEIVEIKNNQIINIKTAPNPLSSFTFKKDTNSKVFNNKGFVKDEISTEL